MLVVPACMFLSLILAHLCVFFVLFIFFILFSIPCWTYICAQLVMTGVQCVKYCNSVVVPVCWFSSHIYVCLYYFYLFFLPFFYLFTYDSVDMEHRPRLILLTLLIGCNIICDAFHTLVVPTYMFLLLTMAISVSIFRLFGFNFLFFLFFCDPCSTCAQLVMVQSVRCKWQRGRCLFVGFSAWYVCFPRLFFFFYLFTSLFYLFFTFSLLTVSTCLRVFIGECWYAESLVSSYAMFLASWRCQHICFQCCNGHICEGICCFLPHKKCFCDCVDMYTSTANNSWCCNTL